MTRSFRTLVRAVVDGDLDTVRLLLDQDHRLASVASDSGARRGGASSYFFEQIKHYLYEGDTALHMAVAERQPLAAQILLDAGADPGLRTRIDECETPLDMAKAAALEEIAGILERKGQPLRKRLRSGLTLLLDVAGSGELVRRQQNYRIRLRLSLNKGEAVRWRIAWGPVGVARLEDHGETLITDVRIDRRSLVNGLFYGVEGMQVGGTRRLEIAPHLGYGERGVPGVIPPNAVLTAEITILAREKPHTSVVVRSPPS